MLFERTLCQTDLETRQKFIINFLETIILDQLANKEMSRYRPKAIIHVKFGVLLSRGSIYPVLDSLVRKGLIQEKKIMRKKLYTTTEKGFFHLNATLDAYKNFLKFLFPTPFLR